MGDVRERVVAGTLRCVARWGVAKTTLDDIAREAGCSRATIYRTFPGGKNSVMLATGEAEVRRLLDDLVVALDGTDDARGPARRGAWSSRSGPSGPTRRCST